VTRLNRDRVVEILITFDKLNINLGKTYAKLRIFPKIF